MAELPLDDVTKILKDAAYVAIGFGVLTVQKVQVQRHELTQQAQGLTKERLDTLTAQLTDARANLESLSADATAQLEKFSDSLDDRVRLVEERLVDLEDRIDVLLDAVEAKLPEQAAELVAQARDAAREARTQVRTLIGRAA